MNPIIIIPARMASTRLPGKPLADLGGKPMIVRVMERALAAKAGPVWIAASESQVADAVKNAGGRAVMTDPDLPSGTDRIHAALNQIDPDGDYDVVVNVQGDLPTMDPGIINAALDVLKDGYDLSTLVTACRDARERNDPNVVKAVVSLKPGKSSGPALYFTRAIAPSGEGPIWHHVGLYAYRREALARFCALPPSPLEVRERLEQLRALEDGMTIGAGIIDTSPEGVDTPDDLKRARNWYKDNIHD